MRATKFITCVLALTLTSLEVTHAHIAYLRNWFGLAFRNVQIDPLSNQCLPDESPCERITDCCSNHCHAYLPVPRCEPSGCGCLQPPWTPEPIKEKCEPYGNMCNHHPECCTGYCVVRCWDPPCLEC